MFLTRISTKITGFYIFSFIVGVLLLFFLTEYILISSLQSKDKDLLEAKFQKYSMLLDKDKMGTLQQGLLNQILLDETHFFVRYQSNEEKKSFFHVPDSMEIFERKETLKWLDEFLQKNTNQDKWLEIPSSKSGDSLEILSKKLPNGDTLQIGKDTEDREEFLLAFRKSFFISLIPFALISLIIGHLLAKKILNPIRWLTDTVKEIRSGLSSARVPLTGSKDELDHLGALFNQIQDQNEKLVQGMKETLDHIAHDLRTPVMRMQNAAHLGLKDTNIENQHAQLEDALIESQETSSTILKILDSIMDISESETGTMSLNKENLSLDELLESVLNIYRFIGEDKDIEIKSEISPNLFIVGDKGKLLQAFANVIDNAIKYSPNQSSIIVRGFKKDDGIFLEIIDEGPGIPANDMPRIWDRLYRGDKSRSTQGLGLGLSFVKAIMNAHQTHIEAANNPSKGCTFRILFPA